MIYHLIRKPKRHRRSKKSRRQAKFPFFKAKGVRSWQFPRCLSKLPVFYRRVKKYTAVRPDLVGLEITKGELRHLSGVSVNSIIRPATPRKFLSEISQSIGLIGLISFSAFLLFLAFPEQRLSLIAVHILVAFMLVVQDAIKIYLTQKHRYLIKLLEDVDRYNVTIKGIDINDQLEAAGNPKVRIKDRERVIQALKLTREDIVRALKTARILRENEKFIKINPELFANNLTALAALQVDEKASQYGRILNEAFQIGLSIQDEIKQLQKNRSLNQ